MLALAPEVEPANANKNAAAGGWFPQARRVVNPHATRTAHRDFRRDA